MNPMPELIPMLKQLRLSGILDSIESRNRQAIEASLWGRAKLSRCIFMVLVPIIGVLSAYMALFRPKMGIIGILHFFKLKRFSRFNDLSSQCHATH